MGYYAAKGLITPGWTLDANGNYCVHPNYIPGDRLRWIVTIKFNPVKIDEKPRMNTAMVINPTAPLVVVL